jgi:uncharacterized repeat protein (TIGR03803 family)
MKPRLTILALALLLAAGNASAASEKALWNFNGTDGEVPGFGGPSLVFDLQGNLYGPAAGGTNATGLIFELSPNGNGDYNETILYEFNVYGTGDGSGPHELIFDQRGNLYSTTGAGGKNETGTVFELSPNSKGGWTETILYSFGVKGGGDGNYPGGDLVLDAAGNLYGTTFLAGRQQLGTVFELSPKSGGRWKETILHNFRGLNKGDGASPQASLSTDGAGDLYGTTTEGGDGSPDCTYDGGCGIVFKLTHEAGGTWKETVPHAFATSGKDGWAPESSNVAIDQNGNLYGTTALGGGGRANRGNGIAWELVYSARNHSYSYRVIHTFRADKGDGWSPRNGITIGPNGSFYGTTDVGGGKQCGYGCGTVFELMQAKNKEWTKQILYSFTGDVSSTPSGLIQDEAGNLYGMTAAGGTYNEGVVFEVMP